MPLTPWLSHYKTDFELARRRRGESIQFDDLRCEAFDRFLLLGFPTTTDAAWRSVDITPLAETYFTMGAKPAGGVLAAHVNDLTLRDAAAEVVFANGYFMPDRSTPGDLPNGAVVAPLASLLASDPHDVGEYFARVASVRSLPLVALNTALFEDGAAILVPPHTTIDTAIHVRFVSTGEADARPAMSQPRVLIVLGEHSRATVVESYAGPEGVEYFTNAVSEIVLGNGATLEHYTVQAESTAASFIGATHAIAGRSATYAAGAFGFGGALVRSETVVTLGGEAASCTLNGLCLADGHRLINTHSVIGHGAPGCVSRRRHRAILAGHARAVFSGSTAASGEAGTTRARQVTRGLLSRDATIEATPSAAVDHLPDDRAARRLLAGSFSRGALNRVRLPPLRAQIGQLFERYLERLQ